MKMEFLTLGAILLGGAMLSAQSSSPSGFGVAGMEGMGGKTQLVLPAPPAGSCPVSMQASHLADGSMVKTGGTHPVGIGQWLSLTLNKADGDQKRILKATLLVHGVRPIGHVKMTLSGANGPDDVARKLVLSFPAGQQQNAQASLWVPGMSAVDRIDLLSLNYSDGSTWKFAGGQSCYAIPDPKMLLVNR